MFCRLQAKSVNVFICFAFFLGYRHVARISQWRGWFGGAPRPPEAGGEGAKTTAAGGTGVSGRSSQRSKFCIFLQKEFNFRAILIKNNAF